jgi:hypothetical protein
MLYAKNPWKGLHQVLNLYLALLRMIRSLSWQMPNIQVVPAMDNWLYRLHYSTAEHGHRMV